MRKSKSPPGFLFAFLGVLTVSAIDLVTGGKFHAVMLRHPFIFILGPLLGIFLVVLVYKMYREYRD